MLLYIFCKLFKIDPGQKLLENMASELFEAKRSETKEGFVLDFVSY